MGLGWLLPSTGTQWYHQRGSEPHGPARVGKGLCPRLFSFPCGSGLGRWEGLAGWVTAGWGIFLGRYLMLWVNGGTAANSGALILLTVLAKGRVSGTQPWDGTWPRAQRSTQRPAPYRGCRVSQTMGEVQKVSGAGSQLGPCGAASQEGGCSV